jgi:hypothetical protein
VHLFNLPPESVTRVVMGFRMKQEKREEIKDIIRANPALRNVQLQQAKPDLDAFRLNCDDVSSVQAKNGASKSGLQSLGRGA